LSKGDWILKVKKLWQMFKTEISGKSYHSRSSKAEGNWKKDRCSRDNTVLHCNFM